MPTRDLPARPHLDHLKNEAKALLRAFERGEPDAVERVRAVIPLPTLKLTGAQRVIAREYGFESWAKLRAFVQSARGIDEAVSEFEHAIEGNDLAAAQRVLDTRPEIGAASAHVAAALGGVKELRALIERDPSVVHARAGSPGAEPLFWLCLSPFHGQSPERDQGLAACARLMLDAGADPNVRSGRFGVPALYGVTGYNNAPRIARMLLEAGANPTDGESAFHAAERYHVEALELLLEFGVDLNSTGGGVTAGESEAPAPWGNTPLYFLLRWWDLDSTPQARRGFEWLLDHGADPNVRCADERETSLHVAVRRRQNPTIIGVLLDHGADVHARRGDGRTPWALSRRAGIEAVTAMLERAGAEPERLSPDDLLLQAAAQGDEEAAARSRAAALTADSAEGSGLSPETAAELRQLMHDAARAGEVAIVRACVAAGLSPSATDEKMTTALHHACIEGRSAMVAELLRRGADWTILDSEHHSTPFGWATFGADFIASRDGDYEGTVRALLEAGALPPADEHQASHAGVRAVLAEFGVG
jgi:ankyrin repeat protein